MNSDSVRLLSVLLAFFLNCSENPIFKDEKVSNNSISGRVELDDASKPDCVFVWSRALDLGTRTDETGFFKLQIPPPYLQPGKGLDGLYALYFYVANYSLDSLEIVMSNGNVQISNEEVNNKGELIKHVKLNKLVEITTSIEPLIITPDFQDTILTTLTFKAYKEDVLIFCDLSIKELKWDPVFWAGFLVDSKNNFVKFVKREERGLRTTIFNVGIYPTALDNQKLMLICDPGMLPSGEYKIVPDVDIKQNNLPKGLIKSLGENVLSYSSSFLRIPIKINGNAFQVIGG